MTSNLKKKLKKLFKSVKFGEPLKKHCTFHIGGSADIFIEIKELDKDGLFKLKSVIQFLRKNSLKFLVIGSGSNILFADKGFRGAIIKISANKITFNEIPIDRQRQLSSRAQKNSKTKSKSKSKKSKLPKSRQKFQTIISADAGVPLSFLIAQANKKGFNNFLPLNGIPGTIGGAVRGNAGANNMETKDALISAKILDFRTGRIDTIQAKDLNFSYRDSLIKKKNHIVLKATFKLEKVKYPAKVLKEIAAYRLANQPQGFSAGSFFKNPSAKKPAGLLIDQCGLKGHKIGGAKISEKHANFIQNAKGKATQKDVLALAELAKKEVFKRFNLNLEEEVQIVHESTKSLQK